MKDLVLGAERLMAMFGSWPSFHDAEVLSLRVDREPARDGGGPTLEAVVHAFEMTDEVGTDGYYVLRNHVLVHLRFGDVVGLRLEDFNHQNALMGLSITDIRDRQLEGNRIAVEFDRAFGVDASFQCRDAEVVSVIPCTKDGMPNTPLQPTGSAGG